MRVPSTYLDKLITTFSSARDSVYSATHSLLKAIGMYTRCYVTLVAAAIPSESGNSDYFSAYVFLNSAHGNSRDAPPRVHHVPDGKGSRKNWTEWDMNGFQTGVARPFKKYIRSMGESALFTVVLCLSYLGML